MNHRRLSASHLMMNRHFNELVILWRAEAGHGLAGAGEARLGEGNTNRRQNAGKGVTVDVVTNTYRITGISPMLMHCGQTADPLNCFSKAMKAQSGKRGKTDEDLQILADLEWMAGLYTAPRIIVDRDGNVEIPNNCKIVIPAHVLDSCIRGGAKKSKEGKLAAAGVLVEGDGSFFCDGENITAMSKDDRFRFSCAVKVGAAKVIRTRPRFDSWSCTFSVSIDPTVIDPACILKWLQAAGKYIGIGDWRPGAPHGGSFGRFVAAEVK